MGDPPLPPAARCLEPKARVALEVLWAQAQRAVVPHRGVLSRAQQALKRVMQQLSTVDDGTLLTFCLEEALLPCLAAVIQSHRRKS